MSWRQWLTTPHSHAQCRGHLPSSPPWCWPPCACPWWWWPSSWSRQPARLRQDGTGWEGKGWEGKEALGQWLTPLPDGLFAVLLLLGCIYNAELASERQLSLAGLLFPHEGSSPEVCGHQSKLTGHCFFSMTTPAPPNGDRCPASDAGLWRGLLFGKKGRKMGVLGAACTAPRSICTDSQGGTQ